MRLQRLSGAIGAASLVATAALTMAPAATASTPAAAGWTGSTGMLFSKTLTNKALRHGVAIIGMDPGGGALITSGKLAYSLPVSKVSFDKGFPFVQHYGGITLSVGDGYLQRSVVLKDITLDYKRSKVTATVFLEEAYSGGGSRESLDTITVFTIKDQPSGPSSFPYVFYVSQDLAAAASGHLGWFPKTGTRLGVALTDLNPPD